jgi:hypothetical protein
VYRERSFSKHLKEMVKKAEKMCQPSVVQRVLASERNIFVTQWYQRVSVFQINEGV